VTRTRLAAIRRPIRLVLALVFMLPAAAAWAPAAAAQDPVIAAAGDIACLSTDSVTPTTCHQQATSDLLVGAPLAAVLPLGDIQYGSSSLTNIQNGYGPTWGRVKAISRPVIGNHEGSGTGYYDYFNGVGVANGPAGVRGKGWYSFDVGTWHLVALNSNCSSVGCTAGSEQEQWLRADLAAHPTSCTLAYWHHPRYSSGHEGVNTFMQPLWEALDDAGAEIVLSGHSHDYERVAPVDRNGTVNPADGIRQFVVGTGGASFTGGLDSRIPQSEVAQNDTFGVLFLTLYPTSYAWRFVPEAGKTFADSGSTACHRLIAPPPPPPPPDVTAPTISKLRVSPERFPAAPKRASRPGISNLTLSRTRFTVASSAAAAKGGTTFRYRLSEAATVTVTLRRKSVGRKVGGKCRTRTRANRRRPACIRFRRVGHLRQQGAAGLNKKRFSGWLGERRLHTGSYRARFVAIDAAGNRSRSKAVSFTIVARRHRPRSALTSHIYGATFTNAETGQQGGPTSWSCRLYSPG
jgi:acid phosphatase type 7